MRSTMDVVRFERRAEGGMRLTLEKLVAAEPVSAEPSAA